MKQIITVLAIAIVAALAFRSDNKPQISYTMPCIVQSIDTFPQGLCVHLKPVGNWQPLKKYDKQVGDTQNVYRIAAE